MAGKFAQTLLHAAPSNQHVHVARGVYQFQRHRPWVASAASLAAGEDPNLLYSEDDIYHSYHDQDAIVVPRSCAHVLQGEEREKTVLWGRWQLRNETFGLFRCLSVVSEAPMLFDATLESWGEWTLEDCVIQSCAGTALRLAFDGRSLIDHCVVGGQGRREQRARIAVEAHHCSCVTMVDSALTLTGHWVPSSALKLTHQASATLERCWFKDNFVGIEIDMAAHVTLCDSVVNPCLAALFLVNMPEWEQRMFPGDSDEIALQFHRRQRAAGIEVSQTQCSEDQVSEDEGVEWGSREWERLRLEEKAERWGFPREYTEKRLEQLQSVGDAHPDQEGRKESESGQHCQFSIWQKYGNASRIVLDNSTLILNKHGNESLFMTPTRPASFQGLRPSQFLLSDKGEAIPPFMSLWRVSNMLLQHLQPHAAEEEDWASNGLPGSAAGGVIGTPEMRDGQGEDTDKERKAFDGLHASRPVRPMAPDSSSEDSDESGSASGEKETKPECRHGAACRLVSLLPRHALEYSHACTTSPGASELPDEEETEECRRAALSAEFMDAGLVLTAEEQHVAAKWLDVLEGRVEDE